MAGSIPRLSQDEIAAALKGCPEWAETGGSIQRTFQFKDFVEAMKFVNKVAEHAELEQHHPDILVRWNKVTLTLSTHDAGGISAKDFALALRVDALAKGFAPAVHAPPPAIRTASPGKRAKR